jgi:hypothetical protein
MRMMRSKELSADARARMGHNIIDKIDDPVYIRQMRKLRRRPKKVREIRPIRAVA